MKVGPIGFDAEGWQSWYPEDLPESWRLHYLAGEYRALFLPRSDWRGWGEEFSSEVDWPEHLAVFVEVRSEDVEAWSLLREQWLVRGLKVEGVLVDDAKVSGLLSEPVAVMNPVLDGWDAQFSDFTVSALAGDMGQLKNVRNRIEASGAWRDGTGVLLFDADPQQLESVNTLVQLLE